MKKDRREFLGQVAATGAAAAALTSRGSAAASDPGEFDLVVIGAGINALGLSILLGEEGWRVLVLERNETPGGSVRTLELTLPGFRHDVGAMNLGTFAGSAFYAQHRDALAAKGAELVSCDHPNGVLQPGNRFLAFTTDLDQNLQNIAAFSKADVEAWKRWRTDFDQLAPVLGQILSSPAAASSSLDYLFGAGAIEVPREAHATLRGILIDSLRTNLDARFESTALKALIAIWGLHIDYAPDIAGGCWLPFLETNADERFGIPIMKGGSGELTRAMAELVTDTGGEVRTGTEVGRIVVEEGRAVGVELEGGELVRAAHGVVAGVTPTALLRMTGDALPMPGRRRAKNWVYGPGTMVIHLALSSQIPWTAEAALKSFYVHMVSSLDQLARTYQQAQAGLLPDDPFVVVGQPTLFDPSRAPQGKETAWVMVRCVPARIRGDAAGEIEGDAWSPELTQAFAQRVLNKIEEHAPGTGARILDSALFSPPAMQRLNPNIVDGDLNSGSQHLSQFYGYRPFLDIDGHGTAIENLYLCGASSWPGGGASVSSGDLLAKELLAKGR